MEVNLKLAIYVLQTWKTLKLYRGTSSLALRLSLEASHFPGTGQERYFLKKRSDNRYRYVEWYMIESNGYLASSFSPSSSHKDSVKRLNENRKIMRDRVKMILRTIQVKPNQSFVSHQMEESSFLFLFVFWARLRWLECRCLSNNLKWTMSKQLARKFLDDLASIEFNHMLGGNLQPDSMTGHAI